MNAHLRSTSHFIEAVRDYVITPGCTFGPLDVTNLFRSIALEDDPHSYMPGLVSIVSNFYDTHRDSSSSPPMDRADFAELLRLVLFGDTYFFRGQHLQQVKGETLAIIYMFWTRILRGASHSTPFLPHECGRSELPSMTFP